MKLVMVMVVGDGKFCGQKKGSDSGQTNNHIPRVRQPCGGQGP